MLLLVACYMGSSESSKVKMFVIHGTKALLFL